MRYLNVVELIIINEELIGGASRLRDVDLLEAAVLRPQTSAFGQDAYPTIIDKAGAFFHSLARNHAFVDGNKRTATVATVLFLKLNGYRVTWEPEQALAFILEVATGQHDVERVTRWLAAHTARVESQPDPPG
ncbi:MAG: type II toxin-antitoxin system death-on-curing family toxin [Phototrophicaceae bacterium]